MSATTIMNNDKMSSSTIMTTISRPKQIIRDYCRRKRYKGPIYYLTHEEKIDLHKHYTVQLLINDVIYSKGIGLSRRNAEFKAALEAIRMFYLNNDDNDDDQSLLLELIKQYNSNNYRSFNSLKKRKNNGGIINRSFSVDFITNRSNSFASISTMNDTYNNDSNDGRNSVTPSIDGIDSIASDFSNVITLSSINNNKFNNKDNHHHNNNHETSSDEGVCTEESECSNSNLPSPNLDDSHINDKRSKNNDTNTNTTAVSKLKFNFLPSSFMLLNSLRDFSRRSFRKSLINNKQQKNQIEQQQQNNNKFNSSSSTLKSSSSSSTSSSTSSTSSGFSINDLPKQPLSLNKAQIDHHQDLPIINSNHHYQSSNLIVDSIIEEEEEEVEQTTSEVCSSFNNTIKTNQNDNSDNQDYGNIVRSYSSSLLLQQQNNICRHNHFSIYGPILCSKSTENCSNHVETATSPSATLLKYCIRMYLPLPYYDINFDQQFIVICRVIMSTTNEKQRHLIPERYIDHDFTAKGYGDILRTARNMAAKLILEKLMAAGLFFEE